jgi:lysophospholipase L1-like esterase
MMSEKKDILLVTIGDSITYGYPYLPAQSWVNIVQKRFNIKTFNKGINGDTTEMMLLRFPYDCLSLSPTHVTIMGGANDAFWGISVASVLENIAKMVELAEEKGIIPIIGLPTPIVTPVEEILLASYRDKIKKLAEDKGLAVIDFYTPFMADGKVRTEYFDDEAHPNIAGYNAMGEAAFSDLKLVFARYIFSA